MAAESQSFLPVSPTVSSSLSLGNLDNDFLMEQEI